MNAAFAGAPGVAFRIGSTDMGRDVWLFGARVRGETSANTALLINYDMQVAKNQMVHTGEAGLSLRF